MDVAALDDPRRVLPPGETGEIRIRGPNVTAGYWNRPEETAAAFADGFFLTGDIGFMDDGGAFTLVDRKKDMIISGGFNVYPRVIEDAIYEHPAVQEAAVIGVPDPYRGQAAKAFVTLRDGAEPLHSGRAAGLPGRQAGAARAAGGARDPRRAAAHAGGQARQARARRGGAGPRAGDRTGRGLKQMVEAVIVSTARTPIGKAQRGAFNNTHGAELGGHVIRHAVERAGIEPGAVEDVVMGCALPEGATGGNIARQAALARRDCRRASRP